MAVVDVKTGRIEGAKEGSFTHWHEKGHIEFDKTEKGFRYGYMWMFSIFLAVVFGGIHSLWSNAIIHLMYLGFVILAIYYYAYEEIWCWAYAIRHKGREEQKEIEKKEEEALSLS